MTDLAAFFIGYALAPFIAPLLAVGGVAALLFLLVLMLCERMPDQAPVPKPHDWTPAKPPSVVVPILVLLAMASPFVLIAVMALRAS
jgi:hypothetical protein